MLADPDVGDHFLLNVYNKVIPSQIQEYWGVLENFFFGDIFFCLFTYMHKKK